jgi:hypothetical protein
MSVVLISFNPEIRAVSRLRLRYPTIDGNNAAAKIPITKNHGSINPERIRRTLLNPVNGRGVVSSHFS